MRPKLRLQFKKKRGNLVTWYNLFKDIKEATLTNMLVLTEKQQAAVDAGPEEAEEGMEEQQEEANQAEEAKEVEAMM